MRAERDPGHHTGGHPSPRPSARFGSGCGRAPVAPLPPPRRTPSRNASPSKSRPFGNTRSRPPLEHHQCVKVGVSQVRKSWCLLTQPTRISHPVPVSRPGYRTQFRPADPDIAPSSGQPTRISHPVPASRPGYRTQFRSADPDIAPSSGQPTRLSHPVPVSRPGYCTQFRSADPDIAPSSGAPTRLLHPVPARRWGYRTQFRPADPVIAPSLRRPAPCSGTKIEISQTAISKWGSKLK